MTQSHSKPVIAIAGLACETSSFSPARTLAPAFHPKRGDEILEKYEFIRPGTILGDAAIWKGALIGHALPGGIVTCEAFEELADEIIARLKDIVSSVPILHGLWYDIHGAMCVEGMDDIEAELLHRIRKVIGPDVIVSASMDLHGNVSRDLIHQTDLNTCYRMAPHEDALDTKERACRNLVDLLVKRPGGISTRGAPTRPLKAWIPIPILLPGEQTSTRDEPAKTIYAAVPPVEATEGIIDAAIWVGYAWADEPRNRAAIVVTGWDKSAITKGAEHLARLFWNSHTAFHFVAPTGSFDECLSAALAPHALRPFFISDSGDNPTAGGSGDMTWGLTQLLARSELQHTSAPSVIYASIPIGPSAIATAVNSGLNSTVTLHNVGAQVDNLHSGPLTLTGRIHAIKHGDTHAVTEIALHTADTNIYAILTEQRKPYHKERDFTDLNLHPRRADVVVVKIGYLEPELHDMALNGDWMLALSPGGVDQDIERLGHKRVRRPMWPFDRDWDEGNAPNLKARIVAASNEELIGPDE